MHGFPRIPSPLKRSGVKTRQWGREPGSPRRPADVLVATFGSGEDILDFQCTPVLLFLFSRFRDAKDDEAMGDPTPGPLCVLLTDFPPGDAYVGVLKGVLLKSLPTLRIVDLAHGLPSGDIPWGALQLEYQARFFPEGSLFLAVVDPGVGTQRRILAARSGPYSFVGPDNGLLSPALTAYAGKKAPAIVAVNVEAVREYTGSDTFHGRDIMAPAAARLLTGSRLAEIGTPITDPVPLSLPTPRLEEGVWVGEVISADGFGNLITSLEATDQAGSPLRIWLESRDLGPVKRCYGEVDPGEAVAVMGSIGRIEISIRDGSAREQLAAGPGTRVEARRDP